MAKEKPIAMSKVPNDVKEETAFRVRRGRVESVDLYEIKDSELDLLEKGSPADLQLNFAIFLLSTAFASFCSLITATFESQTIKIAFIVITVAGVIVGAYLILAWYRNHTSQRSLCKRIRERIPPDVAILEPNEDNGANEAQPDLPKG